MKILVTGGAGFIGSHLLQRLKRNHEVKGVDNFFHASKNPIVEEVEYADVRCIKDIEDYVKWADVIFHLAAQIHVDYSIKFPWETNDVNVIGTLNILELARNYNKKVIFASSSEVYGTAQNELISENHPLDAQSPYAATKVAGDRLTYSYWKTYGMNVGIVRNFNTFGEWQNDDSYGGVIAIFTRNALEGKPLEIFGDGEQERDYMYIDDALMAYELVLEKNIWGKPINFGSGKSVKINDLARMIKSFTYSKSDIIHVKERPGEVRRLCADITLAKSYGFMPKTNLENDLRNYVNWYATNYK